MEKGVLLLPYRALEKCLLKYVLQFLTRKMNSNGIGAEKYVQGKVWNGELLQREETERASFL